jgi:uncharacterized protein
MIGYGLISSNMQKFPVLHRIEIFPIKSLDGVTTDRVGVLPSGALEGDRQFAIVDEHGRFVNGKSTLLVHRLRAEFSPDLSTVTLWRSGAAERETFALQDFALQDKEKAKRSRVSLEAWLSDYFGKAVTLQGNTVTGFPDDLIAPGPTIIGTATLETVAEWFPELDLAEMRRRFRTNLEIGGVPPFWEDRLYGKNGQSVEFQIGEMRFVGINPCQRCIVPTRGSLTGLAYEAFQKQFVQQREAELPPWAERSRFNHFYKLAVNTRAISSTQGFYLNTGDYVRHLVDTELLS